jgi:hypothetical protein
MEQKLCRWLKPPSSLQTRNVWKFHELPFAYFLKGKTFNIYLLLELGKSWICHSNTNTCSWTSSWASSMQYNNINADYLYLF